MKIKIPLILALLFFITSCSLSPEADIKHREEIPDVKNSIDLNKGLENAKALVNKNVSYTIKAGHHDSGTHFALHNGKNWLNFSALFDESCIYDLQNNNNYDINKLYGLTWGLTNDNNSFRIGWNCEKQDGTIQLHWYMHDRGIHRYGYLRDVSPGEWVGFSVKLDKPNGLIYVGIDGDFSYDPIGYNFRGVSNTGYFNFPYFGGDEVAPHDMRMNIITN